MNLRAYHLKCNIKSLVAESRILREEFKKHKFNNILAPSLYHHRTQVVRRALRIANLAYACVRDIPYESLEKTTRLPKDEVEKLLNDVKSKACKFSFTNQRKDIEAWLDNAKNCLTAV